MKQSGSRVDLGASLHAWPQSLRFDGASFWWVAVALDDRTCAHVAAAFLADGERRLDRRLQGIGVDFPDGVDWQHASDDDGPRTIHVWQAAGRPDTRLSVVIETGQLDDWLAEQAPEGADPSVAWFDPVDVPGANRAIRLLDGGPQANDSVAVTVVQAADRVIVIGARQGDEGDAVSTQALQRFVDSVSIDLTSFVD